jgi:hypothetical protein
LRRYGNEFILQGNWIYDQDNEKDSSLWALKHHKLLQKCNSILRENIKNWHGMVQDIKNILTNTYHTIQLKQNKILMKKNILSLNKKTYVSES